MLPGMRKHYLPLAGLVAILPLLIGADAKPAGEVSGGVWLTGKAGNSEILRGLKVRLLPLEIDGEIVKRAAESALDEQSALARVMRDRASKAKAAAAAADKTYDFPTKDRQNAIAKKYLAEAEEAEKTVKAIRPTLNEIPAAVSTDKAYSIVKSAGWKGRIDFTGIAESAQQSVTSTNIEGKYSVKSVPAGGAFLFARFENDVNEVEWLLPVKPGDSADLHNDTAASINPGKPTSKPTGK